MKYYHQPLGAMRQLIADGGPIERRRTAEGRSEMVRAAHELPELHEPPTGPKAEVAFLSGPKYWHETAFCFVSLQMVCPFKVTPIVFDDGTTDEETRTKLRRIIPWIKFVSASQVEADLDLSLPEHLFPTLGDAGTNTFI